MTEKYIDLADRIAEDFPPMTGPDIATLRWLDEHPDQVPGRTITCRQRLSLIDGEDQNFLRGFEAGLSVARCTVVPDPEPTNAKLLADTINAIIDGQNRGTLIGRDVGVDEFAASLDKAGVKAPGGGE